MSNCSGLSQNTMPMETAAAFADHGKIAENSVESGLEEARKVPEKLKEMGIDPATVTEQLLKEGVQKFIQPFDKLLETLADKQHGFSRKAGISLGSMGAGS